MAAAPTKLPVGNEDKSAMPADIGWGATPTVDTVEGEKAYEVIAKLPGMDEKGIGIKVIGDRLTISSEKQEEEGRKAGRQRPVRTAVRVLSALLPHP